MSPRATGTSEASSDVRSNADPTASPDGAEPRPSRRLRVFSVAVVGAAGLLWFAPSLVARHVTSQGITLNGAGPESVRIAARTVSLSWLAPITLADVVVYDLQGTPVARFGSVRSQRQLWRLVTDRIRPGLFLVQNADVTVVVRPDGTNLTDVYRVLSDLRSGMRTHDVAVQLVSGRVHVTDPAGIKLLEIEDLAIHGSAQQSSQRRLELELSATTNYGGERLPLELGFEWTGPAASDPIRSGAGQAGLTFAPVPLSVFGPQLTTLFPELRLQSGRASGQIQATWDFAETHQVQAAGIVRLDDLRGSLGTVNAAADQLHWPSEEVRFALDGDYRPQADELSISTVHVQSSPMTLNAAGRIVDLRGECRIDVAGEMRYDPTPIVERLLAAYRHHVQIDGLQSRRFSVRGPLVREDEGVPQLDLSSLAVEADVGWDHANIFGVRSEKSTLITRFAGAILEIQPHEVPVSGGHWRGSPRVDVRQLPARAVIEPGVLLENIEFSREMCHLWFKYLSPPMSQATSAEGRFSISVAENSIPLHRPADSQFRGTLSIHSAQVRPGPFAEQIIGLVAAIEGLIPGERSRSITALGDVWISFPEQDVAFEMADGRIVNSGLEFDVGPASVRMSGSVGLDESLDLLLEIPIPEDWLRRSVLREMLQGEVLLIPLQGTFQNPRFDRSAVREFARRIAARAGEGLLRRLLDK